ncbi:hypothetical protein STAB901_01655 [Streptococcus pyogenes STAB901]|nr:hypothetical protein STAB901_01655 [Streptococcus pyogenes STAB901]
MSVWGFCSSLTFLCLWADNLKWQELSKISEQKEKMSETMVKNRMI